jgi:multicomponent Na+:H+ antiporter subunit C
VSDFIELVHGYYAYWFCFFLLTLGLYGMLMKRNLVKKTIGLSIFQTAIILFFIIAAYKEGGTVPVVAPQPVDTLEQAIRLGPESYINPLPHTLMLTAIVVGVATLGVAFGLLIRIYESYGSLDEDEILERMK